MMEYEFHPACLMLPKMDDEEYASLKESIKNGYNASHPIILHKGQILDGRHRYTACEELNVRPTFVTKDDVNPFGYVKREHEARRSWKSQEQKAIVNGKLVDASDEWEKKQKKIQDDANRARSEAAREQHGISNPRAGEIKPTLVPGQSVPEPKNNDSGHKTRQAKAAILGVNHGAVKRAETINRKAPELAEKVASGEMPATKALREIKKAELNKAKAEAAAQIKQNPNAPKVSLASFKDWLPEQEQCDLLLTDPPYSTEIENIADFAKEWLPFALGKVKPTGRAFIFIGAYPEELQAYLMASMPNQILVWTYRNTLGPSPKHDYKLNWQAILYYRMPEAGPLDCPVMLEQFSVQDINAPDGRQYNRDHEWQKPDEIAERFIRHTTKPGDLILDPFCCTGTFPLAASKLGRVGLGCDINPEHLKIAEGRGCQLIA
jgi:hypothetical protein